MMIVRETGWSLKTIGELTPGQIYIVLSELTGPSKRDPRTGRPVNTYDSLTEALAYQERLKDAQSSNGNP